MFEAHACCQELPYNPKYLRSLVLRCSSQPSRAPSAASSSSCTAETY